MDHTATRGIQPRGDDVDDAAAESPRRRFPDLSVDVGSSRAGFRRPTSKPKASEAGQEVSWQNAAQPEDDSAAIRSIPTASQRETPAHRTPGRPIRSAADLPPPPGAKQRSPSRNRARYTGDDLSSTLGGDGGLEHHSHHATKGQRPVEAAHSMLQPKSGKAEVHVIGELVGCSGGTQRTAHCRWELDYDPERWRVVKGADKGCTQVSSPSLPEDSMTLWSHPIDIWMTTHSIQRWPSLVLKLYNHDDWYGHSSFCGYAVCPVPTTPGVHDISCQAWVALDSGETPSQRLWRWFARRSPQLLNEDYILDGHGRREGNNALLYTVPAGTVHLRLHVLFKDLVDLVHVGGESLLQSLEKLHSSAEKTRQRARSTVKAMMEHSADVSEGLHLVQQGREARFQTVQQSLDARRTQDQLPSSTPSSRRSSFLNSDARSPTLRGTSGNSTDKHGTWSRPGSPGYQQQSGSPGYQQRSSPSSSMTGVNRASTRRNNNDDTTTSGGISSATALDSLTTSPPRRNYRERAASLSTRLTASPPANR